MIFRPFELLSLLAAADVEFIVVGGVAGLLQNASRRKLRPRASDFAGQGHILLQTPHGMLDVLCELSGQRGYEELLPHCEILEDRGLRIQVLDLPTLIQVKVEAGRQKDKIAIPVLIAALEERKKR